MLTSLEAQKRLAEFGPNVIEGKRKTPLIVQFIGQFKDILVIILIAAAIFAFFADEKVDATIILGIVVLNATIGFFQEFKAEKAIEALKKMLAPKARVIRDGNEQLIDAQFLVPGDLLILNEGDKITADCELIKENELRIDESVMTGESLPVKKDTEGNKKICMGTQVARGNGKAIVVATGMLTEFGKIASLTTETKKDKSPLQKELAHIGVFVGKVTILISGILFLTGLFVQKRPLIDTLLFAVSVAVAAVPEGLPATITVALAIGVQRLARKNAIVKQLSSMETLGSTTVICSDKTGTLTKNEMTVQEMYLEECDVAFGGVGYEPKGEISFHHHTGKASEHFERLFELAMRTATLCNNAKLVEVDSRWQILGDPTEGALITMSEKAGFEEEKTTEEHERIYEIPFDSSRKRMTIIAKDTKDGKISAYSKGAPDSLIHTCTHMLKNGRLERLNEDQRALILKKNEDMAGRALRTIALAYKEIPGDQKKKYTQEEVEAELIFLGLVGMIDPPREEVKEAVKLTHKAGIRVFIVTGDHGLTAHAIARQLGLVKSYGVNIVTGEMIDKISDEKLLQLVAPGQETIFARVSPEHKLRVVETLKRNGEIVAVTGDGVNDAPALKRADIGVAMGITGTDVSKEAANMVLTDDSFGTIVTAVIEGRTIYENMKKFIYYIFAANIGEVLAIFITIMIGLPAPVTAVLILIVNTLTDVFPSLALGVEPVERNILERPPRKSTAKIMEPAFIRRYVVVGFLIGIVTAGTFVWNLTNHGWAWGDKVDLDSYAYLESSTMAFIVLTLLQMVHAFICRSETASFFKMNHFKNMYLIGAVAFSTIMTIVIVQMPFFQKYIKTTGMSGKQWIILVALSFTVLVFEEIRKFFTRRARLKQS